MSRLKETLMSDIVNESSNTNQQKLADSITRFLMGDQNVAIKEITKLKGQDMGVKFSTDTENYNKDFQRSVNLIRQAIERIK